MLCVARLILPLHSPHSISHHTTITMTFDDLPDEVLRCVVDWLHPSDDSPALLNLMQVSSLMWECAARRLYADLTLDEDQVVALIAGADWQPPTDSSGRVQLLLSQRTRTALSYVRRLTILGPWRQPIIDMLWDAATIDCPLFPNVVQVLLNLDPSLDHPYHLRYPERQDSHGIFIFDTIDACVLSEQNAEVLFKLPARRYNSFTCHEVRTGVSLAVIQENDAYQHWKYWHSFQSDAEEALRLAASWLSFRARRLSTHCWDPGASSLLPVQLYLKEGAELGRLMAEWYDANQHERLRVFADSRDVLQIRHYPRSGAGAPPCLLCGTFLSSHL